MLSMTAERFQGDDSDPGLTWEDLGRGAPTIIALAKLASHAISAGPKPSDDLSNEAKAILYTAKERGVVAVQGSNKAFDSVDRFLAVHVEVDPDTVVAFKSKENPRVTVRFLDGLRQLCAAGLVIHQLYREFSLSPTGFEVAHVVNPDDVQEQLEQGNKLGRHEW